MNYGVCVWGGGGGGGALWAKTLFSLESQNLITRMLLTMTSYYAMDNGHAVSATSYNGLCYLLHGEQSQFEIDPKVTRKTVILHFRLSHISTEYLTTHFICTTFENEIARDL